MAQLLPQGALTRKRADLPGTAIASKIRPKFG
jgi:hypothetical protein